MWNWFAFFFASYVRWDRFFSGCLFANLLGRECECVVGFVVLAILSYEREKKKGKTEIFQMRKRMMPNHQFHGKSLFNNHYPHILITKELVLHP